MLASLTALLPKPLKALAIRFDRSPIDTVEKLTEFVRTRASYVAQTSLYGYLKTRMGTRFPEFFEDEVFSASIRMAAAKLFVSCLGDLTVFAVAVAGRDGRLEASEAAALAQQCFEQAMELTLVDQPPENVPDDALEAFRARTDATIWANAAQGADAFAGSEQDILRFAPVVDEFKRLDREIVSNSIRFRWRDVREQLRKRIDADRVCADWRRRAGEPAVPEP
ncbi:MAG TPA: hypothetical protein VK844_06015 [Hyphomicrobiales bacterium]|nr:hypothetical protein [Hyphomicrobiales bacterium]